MPCFQGTSLLEDGVPWDLCLATAPGASVAVSEKEKRISPDLPTKTSHWTAHALVEAFTLPHLFLHRLLVVMTWRKMPCMHSMGLARETAGFAQTCFICIYCFLLHHTHTHPHPTTHLHTTLPPPSLPFPFPGQWAGSLRHF